MVKHHTVIFSSFVNWIISLRRHLLINYLVTPGYSSHGKVSSVYLNFQNNELVFQHSPKVIHEFFPLFFYFVVLL